MKANSSSRALLALSAAALGIPGLASLAPAAFAESPPERTTVSYAYTQYEEDDLDASKLAVGSRERYDIDVHQLGLTTALSDRYGLSLNFARETMSGASPQAISTDVQGNPQVVMSGASIEDERLDVSSTLRRYNEDTTVGVTLGYSGEDDYTAFSGGVDGSLTFNDRLDTVSGGIAVSIDTVEPTQQAGFTRPESEDKDSLTVFAGYTRILTSVSQIQGSLSATRKSGYLSDPYKLEDERPDERLQLAASARYRHFIEAANAAAHVDYRIYGDDWGIMSHTLDLAWYQNINANLQLVPSFRYYTQGQADFYEPLTSINTTGERSSDFRLSPYGAVTAGIKAIAYGYDWKMSVGAERYVSDADFAIESVDRPNPALVEFTRISIGFEYSF